MLEITSAPSEFQISEFLEYIQKSVSEFENPPNHQTKQENFEAALYLQSGIELWVFTRII